MRCHRPATVVKTLRVFLLCVLVLGASTSAQARGRGGGGGGHSGGHSGHSGGGHFGGGHGGGSWHGGARGSYRPFRGGHFGWAPWSGSHGVWLRPSYIWPYGVPWFIYPAIVPGYSGPVPEAVPIQPPADSVVLHAGEITGMNVGQRFLWHCDDSNALVPTLESAGENNLALVLRGNAPGECNCSVSDGESPPLVVHVVVLPAVPTPTSEPPLPPDPTPPPDE